VRIGYSFWGFLGPGITDTPDGGRSHRRPWLDALEERGHHVVLLQSNRDLLEAGDRLGDRYRFNAGLPDLDALVLEWRWPIPKRNTTPCGAPGHTCDLHRQAELLLHYTEHLGVPTVVWDKDRTLPVDDPLRSRSGVAVCEASLLLSPGAHRLLFPVADYLLDAADPEELVKRDRPITLAYVGNQYERDTQFDTYFAPAARQVDHVVAGKWTDTAHWPDLTFLSRVPFPQVREIHGMSLATVLLLPTRYACVGQVTQRVFEAVLAGCVPLAPDSIWRVGDIAPAAVQINDAADTLAKLTWLRQVRGGAEHTDLLTQWLRLLDPFRLSAQVAALEQILRSLAGATTAGRLSA
jgi:hypothetical protein